MKAHRWFCVIALLAAPALVHAQEAPAPTPPAAPATAPVAPATPPDAATPPSGENGAPAEKAKPRPKAKAANEAEDEDEDDEDEEWGPDLPRSSPPSALDRGLRERGPA